MIKLVMTHTPEKDKNADLTTQDVMVRPTIPEIPEHIEKGGLMQNQAASQQFSQKVNDDDGKPLIFTPNDKEKDIVIPDNEDVLVEKAKGSVEETSTWEANFFLRIIKKAIHFGRKLIFTNKQTSLVSDTNET